VCCSTVGLSTLQTLQMATGLQLYHLRAALCCQLFDSVFARESTSDKDRDEALTACTLCMRSEDPFAFLVSLECKDKRARSRKIAQSIPEEVSSPSYPLSTHLKLCLLIPKADDAAELVRQIDSSPALHNDVKEKARSSLWLYLLAEGELFLDGNTHFDGYQMKQKFFYEKMMHGVSESAMDTMINFYQFVADSVAEHDDATYEEKKYVVLACQQTVLRIFIQVYGLGEDAVLNFIKKTRWPVELPSQGAERNLSQWCVGFLETKLDIPHTLLKEEPFEVRFEAMRQENGKGSKKDTFVETENIASRDSLKKKAWILDLDGRFGIFRSGEADQVRDQNFAGPMLAAEGALCGEDKRNALKEYQPTNCIEKMNETPQEQDIFGIEGDMHDLVPSHTVEVAVEEYDEENVEARDICQKEEVEERFEDKNVARHQHVREEFDELGCDDDDEDEGNNSEEELPASCRSEGGNTESEEEDRSFYIDEEEDEVEEILEESIETQIQHDSGEESYESVNEQEEQNDQGSHNQDNPIEIDDSDNPSGNDDMDRRDGHSEAESVASQSSKGSAVVESLDDNQEVDAGRQLVDDEGSNKMDRYESEDDPEGVVDARIVYDGQNDDDDESADLMTARNRQEEAITLERNDDHSGVDVYGMVDEIKTDQGGGTRCVLQQDDDANSSSGLERHSPLVIASFVDSGSLCSNGMFPVAQLASSGNDRESDASDDEHERTLPVEKAETDAPAIGGEFGDTTDDEEEENENMMSNRSAEANRLADALQEGYNSQIGDGYDPDDTHGCTEEDASEAIHTDDEEEERRPPKYAGTIEVGNVLQRVVLQSTLEQNFPHSSDDMDMADEGTEQEDLGAESSELEDTIECTVAAMPYTPTVASARHRDATTLIEFAQTAQHHHDWKPKLKEEIMVNKANPVDIHRDEAFDADDEKDGTEASKNIETEEESLPLEDLNLTVRQKDSLNIDSDSDVGVFVQDATHPETECNDGDKQVAVDGALLGDPEYANKVEHVDHQNEDIPKDTHIAKPSNSGDESVQREDVVDTPQDEAIHIAKPSNSGDETVRREDVVDTPQDEAIHTVKPSNSGEETVWREDVVDTPQDEIHIANPSNSDDETVRREDVVDTPQDEAIHIAKPSNSGDETVRREDVVDTPQDEAIHIAKPSREDVIDTPQDEAIHIAKPSKSVDETVRREDVVDTPQDEAIHVAKPSNSGDETVRREDVVDTLQDEPPFEAQESKEVEENDQLEPTRLKEGDIVASFNSKYLKQLESARVVKVHEDEGGIVTYDLKFLVSRDKAKNVDPNFVFPYDQSKHDDTISSVGTNDEESEATSTFGSPYLTRRRPRTMVESPNVPQQIETSSTQDTRGRSKVDDVASVASTPSRSRATTRSTIFAATRSERHPVAETASETRGGRPPRLQKNLVAKTQAYIAPPHRSEESVSSLRRSSRPKVSKKFYGDSPSNIVEPKINNPIPKEEAEVEVPEAKESATTRGKRSAGNSVDSTEAAALLARRSIRSRAKYHDDESVISESGSNMKANRRRTRNTFDDDESFSSRMSTRSTRSSTRGAKKEGRGVGDDGSS
jgi:hypothetical protein